MNIPSMTHADVKAWRLAHRLTHEQAAQLVGMTRRGWDLWESESSPRLPPEHAAAVLHYIHCACK